MHYIYCSCNSGHMILSLQRDQSLLGEVINRSFTVVQEKKKSRRGTLNQGR